MKEDVPTSPGLAYICHEFPKLTETFVYREVKGLRDRGRTIKVFAMKSPENPEQIDGLEDLVSITRYFPSDISLELLGAQVKWIFKRPLRYFKELIGIIAAGKRTNGLSLFYRAIYFLRGVQLASMIEEERDFQCMHTPATGHELISVHTAHVLTDKPYGFTLHAPWALYIQSSLLAGHARDATWIASISEDARERLVNLAGEGIREKFRIVHCGVCIEDYTPVKEHVSGKIASVASLGELKGLDLLIKATAILTRRGFNPSLVIVGDGPRRNRLESMARELGVSDKVSLQGVRHPDQVRDLLSETTVFALACRVDSRKDRDGIPVALMEAMAMGLPTVSTRISGIPELIEDEVSGLLVEPDDAEALADAIERLLKNRDFAKSVGKAGRRKVERHFTLEGQVERLDELISSKTSHRL